MSRFEEPEEPKVLAFCCQCDEPLEEGQTVVKFDIEHFCDQDCYCKYYEIQTVVLGEEL
jgi:hypothetical protein